MLRWGFRLYVVTFLTLLTNGKCFVFSVLKSEDVIMR